MILITVATAVPAVATATRRQRTPFSTLPVQTLQTALLVLYGMPFDASFDILLTGGANHPKDQVCSITGVYSYCVPEGLLYRVHYHSNQKEGYLVDQTTRKKYERCKARHHHHGYVYGKGAVLDRDGNKCPGVAPVSGSDDEFGSAVLDGRSF